MKKVTLQKLETILLSAVDVLRDELNASQYKDYIFRLLFLKRLNDEFNEEREDRKKEFIKQGIEVEKVNIILDDPSIYNTFYVTEQARWEKIKNLSLNISAELDKAFKSLEDEPKNSELIGVLTTTNYNYKERVQDKKLSQLLLLLDDICLADSDLESEAILGDAYQYLINQYADTSGKKDEEFYTPTVVKVKLQEGDRVSDPTVSSGGMLTQSIKYIKEHNGNAKNVRTKNSGGNANKTDTAKTDFSIVGIGASAGGLGAMLSFLSNVPKNCGLAFVIVQHIEKKSKCILVELLQSATIMKVVQVYENIVVQSDCVYVIPPNKNMSIKHNVLHLSDHNVIHLFDHIAPHTLRMPIDFFFAPWRVTNRRGVLVSSSQVWVPTVHRD